MTHRPACRDGRAAPRRAVFGRVQQVANLRLDEHGLEPFHIEQLFAGHPGEAPIGLLRPRLVAQPVVRLRETDDFVVLGLPVDRQLARVRMTHADLADLDAWRPRARRAMLASRQFPELMWRRCLCGAQSLSAVKLTFRDPAVPHKSSRCHSRRGSALLIPIGDSTMFDALFNRPCAIARHRAGPLLEERLRYLAYLAELGMRRIDLQIMAHFLLVIAQFLGLANRPGEVISREEIGQKALLWAQHSEPRKVPGSRRAPRCSHASPRPGSASWGAFSQHPTHRLPLPERWLNLLSFYAARGVWHPLPSRVVARRCAGFSAALPRSALHCNRSRLHRSTMPLPRKSLPVATAA